MPPTGFDGVDHLRPAGLSPAGGEATPLMAGIDSVTMVTAALSPMRGSGGAVLVRRRSGGGTTRFARLLAAPTAAATAAARAMGLTPNRELVAVALVRLDVVGGTRERGRRTPIFRLRFPSHQMKKCSTHRTPLRHPPPRQRAACSPSQQ
jgi:hypothetical protein